MGGINMWLFMIGLIIAVCGIILIVGAKKDKWEILGIMAILFGGMLMGLSTSENIKSKSPTALDVYRGKTELEITEVKKDTVIINRDTTVVFKKG